ncbi:MAG: hypothetical protein Q9217_006315 [Psora testacea]
MSRSRIAVTLASPTHPEFNWLDSFESLEEEEIEGIILILRGALAAFSAELTDRRKPWMDQALENYKEKLQQTAKQINEQGLTETHEANLDSLKLSLAQTGCAQTERKESKPSKAGRQYLWLISNVIGWPYVLLIICALGKHRMERIDEDQRVKLLRWIAKHRESLFCRTLEDRAIQWQFQEKYIRVVLPLTRGSKKRKRRESTDGATNIELKNQQSVSLAGDVADERDFSPSALERSISDPVIFSKTQAEPQTRGVLSTIRNKPNPINIDEQRAASSATNSSDMVQPSTSVAESCAVLPAAQNHSTSSTTSACCIKAVSGHLNANIFNDMVSQAAPPNQDSVAIIASAQQNIDIDPASKDLATLLSFLGQSKISERLLERARGPLLAWSEKGEIILKTTNTVEVVQDRSICDKAIFDLHQLKAIHIEPRTVKTRYISLNPLLLTRIVHDKDHVRWKMEAVKVVFYAFPMDRRLEPLHSFSIATSALPLLKHVLPLLEEIDVERALPAAHVIEVCLSASYYSSLDWKTKVIAIAEDIGKRFLVGAQLRERVELRKRILCRISSCEWGLEVERLDFIRVDQRSNGYYGEFVLFNADILFGRQKLQAALDELDGYTPWHPGNISTLEQIQMCEIGFLRGKIHHFSGHFKEAKGFLEGILHTRRPEASMMCKAMAHLTAVCCELGETRLGIGYASAQLNDVTAYQSSASGSAQRLKLALANAYLMQGMWVIFIQSTASGDTSIQRDIQQGFDKAQELFQMLAQFYENASTLSRAGKTNRFSTLLGLALIAHIKGDLPGAAYRYDIALDAARRCNWDAGYIEAIIYWSKSVIMHSLGKQEEARKLHGLAGSLYECRSYYFAGLGTLWPEIIGTWAAQQGRERIIPEQGWERTTDSSYAGGLTCLS